MCKIAIGRPKETFAAAFRSHCGKEQFPETKEGRKEGREGSGAEEKEVDFSHFTTRTRINNQEHAVIPSFLRSSDQSPAQIVTTPSKVNLAIAIVCRASLPPSFLPSSPPGSGSPAGHSRAPPPCMTSTVQPFNFSGCNCNDVAAAAAAAPPVPSLLVRSCLRRAHSL